MNILRFHWIRFIGAVLALLLAIAYLLGFEGFSLAGFFLISLYGAFLCIRIRKGTQPAKCDLCGRRGLLKVEHDHGYVNARLILDCPLCGRVVNTAKNGIEPGRESLTKRC